MLEISQEKIYKRKLALREHLFHGSMTLNLYFMATIKGEYDESSLRSVLENISNKHPMAKVRIIEDEEGCPWFTSEDVGEIPLESLPRTSEFQMKEVCSQELKTPFDFYKGPLMKIIVLHDTDVFDLIIVANHILCDGTSITEFLYDICTHMNSPQMEIKKIERRAPFDLSNIPIKSKINPIVKVYLKKLNKKWKTQVAQFDFEDMKNIEEANRTIIQNDLQLIQLTEDETKEFVKKCGENKVTINTAVTTALLAAYDIVIYEGKSNPQNVMVSVDIRDRLKQHPGNSLGLCAAIVSQKYAYDHRKTFWQNARIIHDKLMGQYTDRHVFQPILNYYKNLDPALIRSIKYYYFGRHVQPGQSRYEKLHSLSMRKKHAGYKLMKKLYPDEKDWILSVTNLGNLAIPAQYGNQKIDSLYVGPNSGINIKIVVGILTINGKMHITFNYPKNIIIPEKVTAIKDKMFSLIFGDDKVIETIR